ncbi:hypothetical protein G6F35_002092 [Rhizopus arrhizus]|nr:hypothetical protein G6F35_002092 [Rhizopus arrhizus]
MTALELLTRRTHIRGFNNWFFLLASASSMGGVAIITVFLAFVFVGITEEAKISRIVPSGIIAGLGIASMHYLGQLAVAYFILKNKTVYVICAIIIAICAATAALLIFFKLREQWANQWYKRLGCAMLMGVAVCGMHYTALAGTVYYPGTSNTKPPQPEMATQSLIGVVAGIVVFACIILCILSTKGRIERIKSFFLKNNKDRQKRIFLGLVLFDTNGRILVKIDGTVPTKEILSEDERDPNGIIRAFTPKHPLFSVLLEASIEWQKKVNEDDVVLFHSLCTDYKDIETTFTNASNVLAQELHFNDLAYLGCLYDSVLNTNTVLKEKKGLLNLPIVKKLRKRVKQVNCSSSNLLGKQDCKDIVPSTTESEFRLSQASRYPNQGEATIDIASIEKRPQNAALSVYNSNCEDKYIFLVSRFRYAKGLDKLLSAGFRFADPIFIAKTMSEKLRVPSDFLFDTFQDMLQVADLPMTVHKSLDPQQTYASSIQVGLFIILEEGKGESLSRHIVVDKQRRYTFPMVQFQHENDKPLSITLAEIQKKVIANLKNQSLSTIASLGNQSLSSEMIRTLTLGVKSDLKDIPLAIEFAKSLAVTCKKLIEFIDSNYGGFFSTSATLYSNVRDIPAFALLENPCQLILFRAVIRVPGVEQAINQAKSEPIKCSPIDVYRNLAYFATNLAIENHRVEQIGQLSEQRRIYESSCSPSIQKSAKKTTNSQILPSLSPPPRVKVNRHNASPTIDHIFQNTPIPLLPVESQAALKILPAQQRFSWFEDAYTEALSTNR